MKEIPAQHLEVMAESFRRDGLDGHHAVIRATLDGIADLRAVLRDAEKAREEAERERDEARWAATCDVCLGDPLPGTRGCICGGTGKLADTALGLREELVRADNRATAAESRAARLLTVIKEIESKTGHFGEAPPPPEWMPMLSLIAWVGRIARAAIAAEEGK